MLLFERDHEPFVIGKTVYQYQSAPNDITPRIILHVQIEGVLVSAILDTGAPYVVCAPHLAHHMGIDTSNALERKSINIRGYSMKGGLHRLNIRFLAIEGVSLNVEATTFVPDSEWQNFWDDHPSYIGLTGCLERMRFAIDPNEDTFYFGSIDSEQYF